MATCQTDAAAAAAPAGSGLDDQTDTVVWCVCGAWPQATKTPWRPFTADSAAPPVALSFWATPLIFQSPLHNRISVLPARLACPFFARPRAPPSSLSRFATQRRCHRSFLGQRPARRCALVPATTKRLSHRRSAANATPAARLPPPKRPPLIPTSVHASASCIFGCFHGAPPPAPNHGLGFCGSGFWRLPPSFSTPCLSQRHCRLQ